MVTIKLQNYRKLWDRRLKELRKVKKKTTLIGAKFMQAQAKKMAPKKTGETLRGIRKRKVNNGWVVESVVSGRFKQNLFANQSAPFRTLKFNKKNRYFKSPQTVVYGRGAVSTSGKAIQWTGKPRFWHFAALRSRAFFGELARKNTKKALRVRI